MKKKKKTFDKLYAFNKSRNSYSIDVSLDEYEDVYGEWDDSSFRKRVVEQDFEKFILSSTRDIPLKYGLQLNLYLPLELKSKEKETNLKKVYQSYYDYEMLREKNKRTEIARRIVKFLVIGIIFFVLSFFIKETNALSSVICQGMSVLAWVSIWQVAEEFFFESNYNKKRLKNINRIKEAKINFIYREDHE